MSKPNTPFTENPLSPEILEMSSEKTLRKIRWTPFQVAAYIADRSDLTHVREDENGIWHEFRFLWEWYRNDEVKIIQQVVEHLSALGFVRHDVPDRTKNIIFYQADMIFAVYEQTTPPSGFGGIRTNSLESRRVVDSILDKLGVKNSPRQQL